MSLRGAKRRSNLWTTFRIDCFGVALLLLAMTQVTPLYAGDPLDYTVTLKKFELKNTAGEWITVIEPDRVVDLIREEAKISFFNSTGRVPSGRYVNFRLTMDDGPRPPGFREAILMTRKDDFAEPFDFRKGSFIFAKVEAVLENPVRRIEEITLTVDERSVVMGPDEILIDNRVIASEAKQSFGPEIASALRTSQ